jgi:hypothetical protein
MGYRMRQRKACIDSHFHPHPLNHVRFRVLSCTLRGAGLSLPPAYRQAGIEGEGMVWVYSKGG